MDSRPALVIYRDQLLPASQTFVLGQAEALRRFRPFYVGSRLVKDLDVPGNRLIVLHRDGPWGYAREIGFKVLGWFPYLKELRKIHPVLVHAHFGPDGILALPLAVALRVPLVVTLHGFEITASEKRVSRMSYMCRKFIRQSAHLQQRADLFITVSRYAKSRALARGFPPDKVRVHYTGIDTEYFSADPRIEREQIVLFVGRLVEKKGCEYLIRAMADVQKALPAAKLVVIGDGPLDQHLEQQASSHLRQFEFLGRQTPEQVKLWMNRARVFSTPSLVARSGDAETFGMVFAEAQAMGLPVAGFASGGVPEAVEHGRSGLLCEERDWRSLARNILRLLTDKNQWRSFSRAGEQHARECFDIRKQTAVLELMYTELLRV